jgi:glycosyltransferase involved in cell wall biosynthesis
METLVTIIIPTYNAEKYIAECLNSIFVHKSSLIETIVLDGGSTDNTHSILSAYSNESFRWLVQCDSGIYDAMNKGVDLAKGKWLYFMGADDRLQDGFFELLNKLSDQHAVYYGNSAPFYEDGVVHSYGLLQGEFSAYRLAKYCMNHQSIIYPAAAFKNNRYELKYKVLADYAFNLRLWGDKRFKKLFFPITIVSYNMGGFSAANRDIEFYKDKSMLVRTRLGLTVFMRYLFRDLKDRLKGRERV